MTVKNDHKIIFEKVEGVVKKYSGTSAVSKMKSALLFSYEILDDEEVAKRTIDDLAETFNHCNSAEELYSVGKVIINTIPIKYSSELVPQIATTLKKYVRLDRFPKLVSEFNESITKYSDPNKIVDIVNKWLYFY